MNLRTTERVEAAPLLPDAPDEQTVNNRLLGVGVVIVSLVVMPLFLMLVFAALGWMATAWHWMIRSFAG